MFTLEQVVPWGRSFDEYCRMFALSEDDLALRNPGLWGRPRQLQRRGHEIRVFPLLALGGHRSPYVDRSVEELLEAGHEVSIQSVPYEFQRGGNQMMRIRTRR